MATVGSAEVRIDADVVPMLRQIRRALRSVNGVVDIDTRRAVRSVRGAANEVGTLERALNRVARAPAAALTSIARFGSAIGRSVGNAASAVAGMAAQFVLVAVVIGAATVAAARFVATIAPGVFSVAAGAIAILVAGVLLARPAFENFLTAVKGSDEALSKLSPSARAAAESLRTFGSIFDDIQPAAQEAAFAGLADRFDALRANLARLSPQVLQVSSALNTAMAGALDAINSRFGDVETISTSAGTAFTNLSGATDDLVRGLLAVAAAGAKIGASFSDEVAARLERAGKAMEAFADAGGVEKSVDKASAAFDKLGSALSGLSAFFAGVLDVAKQFGEGFGKSFAGTTDIEETLRKMGESVRDFGPAARDLGEAVGNVAKGFQQLKPILLPVVEILAELIRILSSITGVGALVALSAILSRLGISLATQRAAITAFGNALRTIASAAGRARIVSAVGTAIRVVVAAIAALVAAVGGVVAAVVIVVAFVAAFAAALVIFPEFRKKVVEVLKTIGESVVEAFNAVIEFFQSLPGKIAVFVATFVSTIVTFFSTLPGLIINAIVTLPGLMIEFFLSTLGTVLAFIITAVGEIIVFFLLLPGRIIEALSSLASLAFEFFGGVFATVGSAVTTGINAVIGFFAALPGNIIAAVSALPGMLQTVGQDAFAFLQSAVTTGIANVLALIQGIPAAVQSLLSNAGTILYEAGQNIVQGLIDGIESMVGKVGEAISSVTGKIADALPGSPVKEGPLSGGHQPNMLGEKLSEMIAAGIRAGVPAIRKATNEATRAAALPVPGVSGTGPGPRIVRNNTSTSNVSVNIVTGSTDGDVLASILGRRLQLGGA